MSSINLCAICNKASTQSCSQCNNVFYCNRDHQKSDWKKHKTNCAPFRIIRNEVLGRHVVAIRDIAVDEVLMRKKPLVIGPKLVAFPMCLGCHKRLDCTKPFVECSKCRWPICGRACEQLEPHRDECFVFKKNKYCPRIKQENVKQGNYGIITPVRGLLLKQTNPSKFATLMSLQDNLDKVRDNPIYGLILNTIVPIIRDVLKIDTTTDEILKISSIFDTNAFEIRDQQGLVHIRGVYPMISMISHDCNQNTKHAFHGPDHEMVIRTTRHVRSGSVVTKTYTQTLWNTLARREHLRQSKHFDCACARCADPTELGTYLGAISCSICREKKVNSMVVSTEPLNDDADWKCERCHHVVSAHQMRDGNRSMRREIAQIERGDPKNFEKFLAKYRGILHATNSHIVEVKYALCQMYGNMPGYELNALSKEYLTRKMNLCKELLEVAEVLEGGLSKFRGNLLYDLQATIVEVAKRNYSNSQISKEEVTGIFNESLEILQEAVRILKTEPGMAEILQNRIKNIFDRVD